MKMYSVIEKKRDGHALSKEEIEYAVNGYTAGEIPDYQMSALLMAIFFRGMTDEETACLTMCMARSGDMTDLSALGTLSADKHSTGGVGDKTTLIACPIAASLGVKIAKMSGRGLGYTGGTADKLEAIPGYKTSLSPKEFIDIALKTGLCVATQSGNLTPADKKLYALRDVTATVDSIPLIASSIMSKKIAAGAKNIVLDVKCGSGAFMKTPHLAHALARQMIKIGTACQKNVRAVISNMDVPLGKNIGNSLEVTEALEVLSGGGDENLAVLSTELAANMASLALGIDMEEARRLSRAALKDGSAKKKFAQWMAAQGADCAFIENPSLIKAAKCSLDVISEKEGFITHMDTEEIGKSCMLLGSGRKTLGADIDLTAGITVHKKTGDTIKKGEALATLYANDPALFSASEKSFLSAVNIGEKKAVCPPVIL